MSEGSGIVWDTKNQGHWLLSAHHSAGVLHDSQWWTSFWTDPSCPFRNSVLLLTFSCVNRRKWHIRCSEALLPSILLFSECLPLMSHFCCSLITLHVVWVWYIPQCDWLGTVFFIKLFFKPLFCCFFWYFLSYTHISINILFLPTSVLLLQVSTFW